MTLAKEKRIIEVQKSIDLKLEQMNMVRSAGVMKYNLTELGTLVYVLDQIKRGNIK